MTVQKFVVIHVLSCNDYLQSLIKIQGLPWWSHGKESTANTGYGFSPEVLWKDLTGHGVTKPASHNPEPIRLKHALHKRVFTNEKTSHLESSPDSPRSRESLHANSKDPVQKKKKKKGNNRNP